MCGIAGFFSPDLSDTAPTRLRSMCDAIIHRGPDDEGFFLENGVGLGMRRLSIIDVGGGHQPIFNEDRSVVTVFNGEIYNFRELRQELIREGHTFATRSDTEVIVHAYEQFGASFAKRLNGMFAIALYDRTRKKLLLARDHVGIKPLYYAWNGSSLVWGSEIKSVLASGMVPRELDLQALGEFMAWEYCPAPRTLFQHIRKLEPGHMIELDLPMRRLSDTEFWRPRTGAMDSSLGESEWIERIDQTLHRAVQRQMVSDVPLGAFLSGGVDSSLIVAGMGDPVTFSIGFEDPSYNELSYSTLVAKHLNVRHITQTIVPDALDLFQELMYFMDDPIGDSSIFPTFLVSRLARQHVKVALSGDGGDELFGGYDAYQASKVARLLEKLPGSGAGILKRLSVLLRPTRAKKGFVNKLIRFAEGLEHDPALGHARWRIFLTETQRQALFTPAAVQAMQAPVESHIERLFTQAGGGALESELLVDTRSYLPDDILTKVDRMSMAVSLETRVPFLDTEMVDLAFRIPDSLKLRGLQTKYILKKVAERYLPKECVHRRKEGFSSPIKQWIVGPYRELMEESLSRSRIEREGLFRWETVLQLKNEHLSGARNHSHQLWSLMVFHAWEDHWLSNDLVTGAREYARISG